MVHHAEYTTITANKVHIVDMLSTKTPSVHPANVTLVMGHDYLQIKYAHTKHDDV